RAVVDRLRQGTGAAGLDASGYEVAHAVIVAFHLLGFNRIGTHQRKETVVKRMTSLLTAAIAVTWFVSTSAAPQKPPTTTEKATAARNAPGAKTPQQELDEAKRLLDGINEASLDGDASRRLAMLKSDMNELAAAYLGQKGVSPPTGAANRPA